MSSKREMIEKMLEMQRKFIAYEREHGVNMEEYLMAPEGHPLHDYRQDYMDTAMKVVGLAHEERGSKP